MNITTLLIQITRSIPKEIDNKEESNMMLNLKLRWVQLETKVMCLKKLMDTTTEIYLIEVVVLTNITSTNKPSIKTEKKDDISIENYLIIFNW